MVLVNTDVLEADQVLAIGDVIRDGELHAVLLPGAPAVVDVGRAVGAALPDLEPVSVTHVLGDGARGLGHVDHPGARVLDELVVPQLGRDLVTGFSIVSLGRRTKGALVTPEVLGVDDLVGERRLVVVAVLADVVVVTSNGFVVDDWKGMLAPVFGF